MRVPELKALTRDGGLRNYSRMRRAELVALLQNNPPPAQSGGPRAPTPHTRPPPPPSRSRALKSQLKLENLQMIGDRGLLLNKKWMYLNNKK